LNKAVLPQLGLPNKATSGSLEKKWTLDSDM
jgi:hypothetical protein